MCMPHQQRVIDEKTELDERLKRLAAFFGTHVFASLPLEEQDRLARQKQHMDAYSNVLGERIAAFSV